MFSATLIEATLSFAIRQIGGKAIFVFLVTATLAALLGVAGGMIFEPVFDIVNGFTDLIDVRKPLFKGLRQSVMLLANQQTLLYYFC